MTTIRAQDKKHLSALIAQHVQSHGAQCSLNHIDVSGITDFSHLFESHKTFNGDISSWNTANVQDMRFCFFKSCVGGNISNWDVSSVRHMDEMFSHNTSFFGDLSAWDVGRVESMAGMFAGSKLRDGLSNWNVGSVTKMRRMFEDSDFCGDIARWDVARVQTFERMFEGARRFNGDVSLWDVSGAMHFGCMFSYAGFNGDISQWDFQEGANLVDMFTSHNLHTVTNVNIYHWWLASTNPELLTPSQREHFAAWAPVVTGLGLGPIAQARAMQSAWLAQTPGPSLETIAPDLFA